MYLHIMLMEKQLGMHQIYNFLKRVHTSTKNNSLVYIISIAA